nr:MAG TPA: Proteasome-associated ATPase, Prokaryotic ubiquitin-like protein coil alpha helix, ATP-binding.8A [Caudoviricetes sp.]
MDRLTFDGSFCDIAQCTETPGGSFCEDGYCSQKKVWDRLKQYEDTGCTPEEIENQQRHIEALMKANDSLKDAIARRDKQIEDMKQGMAQLAKAVAVKEEHDGSVDYVQQGNHA